MRATTSETAPPGPEGISRGKTRPELGMGRGSGHVETFGLSFDSDWGELSEVEFAS